MMSRRKSFYFVILTLACILIHFYSISETRVENGYSTHFYARFASILRDLFGNINFSIGDILYALFGAWLLWQTSRFLRFALRRSYNKRELYVKFLYRLFVLFSSAYIIFNIFWGINYNRKGIAWQLGLDNGRYTTDDLRSMNQVLVEKINTAKTELMNSKDVHPSDRELFKMVTEAYKKLSVRYPFLSYRPMSIKTSMWGWLGNYTGFTGYYNPFTGEAQVNTTVPTFLHSFVTCHEVAHQLGYAKEMEANFVGYLAASNSGNTLMHYSVYLDLFIYSNRNLNYADSAAAGRYRKELLPAVIKDLRDWADFNRRHENWAEPVVRWLYGKYLQGNKQPGGVLSYDEVTGFLIAFYKKYGYI
ncbi:MAG: DUF3810 domain-containing protein [Ferruginibacter sp.]